jgi:hypothetical protein
MGNYKEDTDQNSGTFFTLILFLLFVFASSANPENHTSSPAKFPSQNELVFGDISSHRIAILFNAVRLPDLYKNCTFTLRNTSLNLFSLQYKISSYNHLTAQNLINIQKTRLVIKPLFLWRLYHPLCLSRNADVPVLS